MAVFFYPSIITIQGYIILIKLNHLEPPVESPIEAMSAVQAAIANENKLSAPDSISGTWAIDGNSSDYYECPHDGILVFTSEAGLTKRENNRIYLSTDGGNSYNLIGYAFKYQESGSTVTVPAKKGWRYYADHTNDSSCQSFNKVFGFFYKNRNYSSRT